MRATGVQYRPGGSGFCFSHFKPFFGVLSWPRSSGDGLGFNHVVEENNPSGATWLLGIQVTAWLLNRVRRCFGSFGDIQGFSIRGGAKGGKAEPQNKSSIYELLLSLPIISGGISPSFRMGKKDSKFGDGHPRMGRKGVRVNIWSIS